MDYRCAHRWAFPKWGEALELQQAQLEAPTGHAQLVLEAFHHLREKTVHRP
jgi:hypothetical protein